jgi:protein TonB
MAGLALAASVHGALIVWLLGQTFHAAIIADNTPPTPPMTVETLDLTPPQPAPTPPSSPSTSVHDAASTQRSADVVTLPVKVADSRVTSRESINPFAANTGEGGLTLAPPAFPPHVLTNPSWMARPNADQIARAYPEGALRQGLSGTVTLACQVTATGAVIACKVASESPAAHGFGTAALGLTPYFRIRPGTDNGEPIEGDSVVIPIRFQIGG